MQNSVNSPLKNLERISEDLRAERSKASLALQEKSRLRVEIESLKQSIEKQADHIKELNSVIAKSESDGNFLKQDIAILETKLQNETKLLNESQNEVENLKKIIQENSLSTDALNKELSESNLKIANIQSKVDLSESLSKAKDNAHNELQSELFQLRKKFSEMERHCDHYKLLYDEIYRSNEDSKAKIALFELAKDQHVQLQISYAEIKRDYESSLAFSNELSRKHMIAAQQNDEFKRTVTTLQNENSILKTTCERNKRDLSIMEQSRDEVLKHLQAEKESAEAAHSKAAIALRGKGFLEQQLHDFEVSQHESLKKAAKLESDLAITSDKLRQLENEIVEHRQRSNQIASLEAQASERQAMSIEIEALKAHLAEVKKQLIKRDVDDEASSMVPKAIFERENQSRQVYESIIAELRNEIEKLQSKNGELQSRLEQYLTLTTKYQQMQLEVELYKEAAKQASMENHNIAMSASEALERSSRVSHDKSALVRELQRLENECHLNKSEINRITIELESERSRRKEIYTEKLTSDRKLAEASASKVRLEALIDDEKQKRIFDSLEIERQKKTIVDLNTYVSDLTGRIQDLESIIHEKDSKYNSCNSELLNLRQNEESLQSKLKLAQHTVISLQKEKETSENKIQYLRSSAESISSQIRMFVSENEELRNEKETLKRQLTQLENDRQENSLKTIRSDLENTVNEFNKYELDRSQKDNQIGILTADFRREKERNNFLKSSLSVAEERIATLSKEIAIYRSIDVYKHPSPVLPSKEAKSDQYSSVYSSIYPNEDSSLMNQLRSSLNNSSIYSNYNSAERDNNQSSRKFTSNDTTADIVSHRRDGRMGLNELDSKNIYSASNRGLFSPKQFNNSQSELDSVQSTDNFNTNKEDIIISTVVNNDTLKDSSASDINSRLRSNSELSNSNSNINSNSSDVDNKNELELDIIRQRKLDREAKRAEMIRIQMANGSFIGSRISTPSKVVVSQGNTNSNTSNTGTSNSLNNSFEKSPNSSQNDASQLKDKNSNTDSADVTIDNRNPISKSGNGSNPSSNSSSSGHTKFDFERAKRIMGKK